MRPDRTRVLAHGSLLAVVAGYLVTTLPGVRAEPGYSWWMDGVLQPAAYAAAALLCAIRIPRASADRLAWRLIALGLLSQALSHLAPLQSAPPGYPASGFGVSDLLAWGFYGCTLVALVIMLRTRMYRLPAGVALDGLVVGLGAATLTVSILLPQLAKITGADTHHSLVALASPTSDLVLLVVFTGALSLLRWRPPTSFAWLIAGLVLFGLADCAYIIRSGLATYHPGGPVDALRLVAVAVIALAPGRARPLRGTGAAATWMPVAAPIASAVLATGVLLADERTPIHSAAVYLAVCTIVAALCRLAVAFFDARRTGGHQPAATTDDLTALLNRRGFYEHAGAVLEPLAEPGPGRNALLLLDLDRFKDINDSLEHTVGDRLLQVVAARLRSALGRDGILARLGGDEFAVLLPGADRPAADLVADRLLDALDTPIELDGLYVQTSASIGISLSPDHCDDIGTLLRYADIAMYEAKSSHHGHQIFHHGVDGDSSSRAGLELLAQLRQAIELRELTVHYQPQIRLTDERTVGVEALVRWEHPERGLLYPHQFLPLAQHNYLMPGITELVLDLALHDSASWRERGHPIPVAINLPPSAFADTDLPARAAAALARHRVEPGNLTFEITEDFLLANLGLARSVLNQLRDMGIRIAIDDFGSGYASLYYLRELPVDELKLDRTFTAAITTDPTSAAIVRSVIDLSHTLGLTTVAEGVETAADADALNAYGCAVAQGHYYSPALDSAGLLSWAHTRQTAHAVSAAGADT